jgi:ribA/ribD-fused uncharacterized protein
MEQFIGNDFNKETEDTIYFYTPIFYALDNFSSHIVEIWDKKFQTSEHAYQWKKFEKSNPAVAEEIFKATNPNDVKRISDAHKASASPEFHEMKIIIMEEILRAKTAQHEKVRKILKESGTKTIVENSPIDSFWGAGHDGKGENTLGKLWMKIRDSQNLDTDPHTLV